MHLQMTRSCTYIVIVTIQHPPWLGTNAALQTWVVGCPPTVLSLTQIRRSCSGLVRSTTSTCWPIAVHLYSLMQTVVACEHVRLLGVTISSDLSLHKHVSNICAKCFYWLRQLWCARRSLNAKAAATLVHAFVMSHVDYCNAVLAGAPKSVTNELQRVLNVAARVVSGTRKYDRGLTTLIHT